MKVLKAVFKFFEVITEGRRMRIEKQVSQYIAEFRKWDTFVAFQLFDEGTGL